MLQSLFIALQQLFDAVALFAFYLQALDGHQRPTSRRAALEQPNVSKLQAPCMLL